MENAVSTLVVRARPGSAAGAPAYWVRKVRVVGLPEVFYHFQHEASFEEIYSMWLEGRVVIRKRMKKRGRAAGKDRRKGKGKGR